MAEEMTPPGASVNASLLFLQKFTRDDRARFDQLKAEAWAEVEAAHEAEVAAETRRIEEAIEAGKKAKEGGRVKELQKELAAFRRSIAEKITAESRKLGRGGGAAPRHIPQAILAHLAPSRAYSKAELCAALHLTPAEWAWAIRELKDSGKVVQTGERRGARYALAGGR